MHYTHERPETRKEAEKQARLEFTHFVVVSSEGAIIAFARNNGSTYKFLMDANAGWIRIESTGQWLELPVEESENIRHQVQESFGNVPVYRVPRFIT